MALLVCANSGGVNLRHYTRRITSPALLSTEHAKVNMDAMTGAVIGVSKETVTDQEKEVKK
jgi:hypothetical protein